MPALHPDGQETITIAETLQNVLMSGKCYTILFRMPWDGFTLTRRAAPPGNVSAENGRRALPTITGLSRRVREHAAVIGFEPAPRALTDDLVHLNDLVGRSIASAASLAPRERKHDAVIGFEPAARALTDNLAHLEHLNNNRDHSTPVKRGQGVVTETRFETTTGPYTFYSCKDGWFTASGTGNGTAQYTSSGMAALPAVSNMTGLVPNVSEGVGTSYMPL